MTIFLAFFASVMGQSASGSGACPASSNTTCSSSGAPGACKAAANPPRRAEMHVAKTTSVRRSSAARAAERAK
eukprot:CAMPEP_0181529808 /NCGR_PEP_ID=MMETSP1110-20121109/71257_1 /TAXON_ID=174948 /ORGANISM="Symbiodinium sp., Strain CCMP421" /LENGTH=72 /DNA_ID=CAMNT_0023660821 /DNA_START=172 /DNA_END=390 /DNA_ORIENTATION=-